MTYGFRKEYIYKCALTAEFLAILAAMSLVETHQLGRSIIYLDCLNVAGLILNLEHANKYSNVTNACRRWHMMFPKIPIRHCDGKFNCAADSLTKACRSMDEDCVVTRNFPTPSCLEHLTSL